MKILKVLLVAAGFFALASCGGDDCLQADWIGTYSIDTSSQSSSCDSTSLVDALTITAGSTSTSIEINGLSYELDNCEVGEAVFGVGLQYTLNGDKVDVVFGTCDVSYTRN